MDITLSKEIVVKEIKAKTQAKMFKNVKVGDRLRFCLRLGQIARHSGLHATYIYVYNLTRHEYTRSSMNMLVNTIERAFVLEPIGEESK